MCESQIDDLDCVELIGQGLNQAVPVPFPFQLSPVVQADFAT